MSECNIEFLLINYSLEKSVLHIGCCVFGSRECMKSLHMCISVYK